MPVDIIYQGGARLVSVLSVIAGDDKVLLPPNRLLHRGVCVGQLA